jgi:hypothetical protein
MLAFRAEEGNFAPLDAENQGSAAIFAPDLFKLPQPAPQGVVPKKPKALIQVYFSGQTVEVGAKETRLMLEKLKHTPEAKP